MDGAAWRNFKIRDLGSRNREDNIDNNCTEATEEELYSDVQQGKYYSVDDA